MGMKDNRILYSALVHGRGTLRTVLMLGPSALCNLSDVSPTAANATALQQQTLKSRL